MEKRGSLGDQVFKFELFDDAIGRECEMIMSNGSIVRQAYGWCTSHRASIANGFPPTR